MSIKDCKNGLFVHYNLVFVLDYIHHVVDYMC